VAVPEGNNRADSRRLIKLHAPPGVDREGLLIIAAHDSPVGIGFAAYHHDVNIRSNGFQRAYRVSQGPCIEASYGLCQCCLCLRQPEGHVQSTAQRDGGGQFGASLLMPVHFGIQGAKAEVAVGHERAHTEFLV
jgi:hypothetical protein